MYVEILIINVQFLHLTLQNRHKLAMKKFWKHFQPNGLETATHILLIQ